MRKLMVVLLIAATTAACQKEAQVQTASLQVSAVVIEPATKTVTAEDMTVFIDGENFHAEYSYGMIPSLISVPVDKDIPYVVSAENVTVEEAESLPDIWGMKRYAGSYEVLVDRFMQKDENGKNIPLTYPVTVHCAVANSMISVVFDSTVLTYYSQPVVTAYTDEDRILEFTPSNASEAVAHFTSGKPVYFEFSGIFNVSGEIISHSGNIEVEPATSYTLTFRMQNTQGSLQQPAITVDKYCEDIYETMTVDPSDDGRFEK